MYVCMSICIYETERQRDGETDRQTGTQAGRHTGRQRRRRRQRQRQRQRGTKTPVTRGCTLVRGGSGLNTPRLLFPPRESERQTLPGLLRLLGTLQVPVFGTLPVPFWTLSQCQLRHSISAGASPRRGASQMMGPCDHQSPLTKTCSPTRRHRRTSTPRIANGSSGNGRHGGPARRR